ncbi:MAG: PEGA domain-containing protein [Planctomycetes bacterium]|jgi:hypothetical protein|nr:PEGA domain-containing protein [Planctomycetota bacterium]
MARSTFEIALLLALAPAWGACRAQRELVISSEPPGAEIRLDGELQAQRTPAKIPFTSYGVRRITLYLDGHLTYSEAFEINAPWYAYFPVDILSEIVFPVGWRDRHKLRVRLVPGTEAIPARDLVRVLQRAEALRRAGPEGLRIDTREARELPSERALLPGSGTGAPAGAPLDAGPSPEPPSSAPPSGPAPEKGSGKPPGGL